MLKIFKGGTYVTKIAANVQGRHLKTCKCNKYVTKKQGWRTNVKVTNKPQGQQNCDNMPHLQRKLQFYKNTCNKYITKIVTNFPHSTNMPQG